MRVKPEVLVAALLIAACSSHSGNTKPAPMAGQGGLGGGGPGAGGAPPPAAGGSGGGPATGGQAGGSAGSAGGAGQPDDAAAQRDQASAPADVGGGAAADRAADVGAGSGGTGGVAGGGKALMVVGTIPLVGTDAQIRDAIKARGVEVEEIRENVVTAADGDGKRLIILSYSMLSTALKASFADTVAPVIVLEHNLLPGLGMTSAAGHGFQTNVTQITITGTDPALTAGLPAGDVTVYTRSGSDVEVFWGVPGPGGITVATVKGNPGRPTYYVYPAGAMMVGRTAPAKRMQFFFAAHAPPPVRDQVLSESGLKLLGAAIDWSLR